MPADLPDAPAPALARARLRGKRVALVLVGLVAAVVIVQSVFELTAAVFGLGVRPVSDRACAEGIHALVVALDRSLPAAGSPAFAAALQPEWKDAESTRLVCARSAEGLDAWASLLRLRSGEEQLAGRTEDDLGPVRRDVIAHLPADLR